MSAPTTDRGGIQQAIRALVAAGYTLDSVDDGGDEDEPVSTEPQAVEAITAVDDAWLYVKKPDGERGLPRVRFVMGNDPEEVICDYSMTLEDVLGPLIDSWI